MGKCPMNHYDLFRKECLENNRYEIFKDYCIQNNVEPFSLYKPGGSQVREVYKKCFKEDVGYWNCRNFRDDLARKGYQVLFYDPVFNKEKAHMFAQVIYQRGLRINYDVYINKLHKEFYHQSLHSDVAYYYSVAISEKNHHLEENYWDREEKIKIIAKYLQGRGSSLTLNKDTYSIIKKLYLKFFSEKDTNILEESINDMYIERFIQDFKKYGYPNIIIIPKPERKKLHTLQNVFKAKNIKISRNMEGYMAIQKVFEETFKDKIPIATAKGYAAQLKNVSFNSIVPKNMEHDFLSEIIDKLPKKDALFTVDEDPEITIHTIRKELRLKELPPGFVKHYFMLHFDLKTWDPIQANSLFLEKKLDYLTFQMYRSLFIYFKESYIRDNDSQRSKFLQTIWMDKFNQHLSDNKALMYIYELYHSIHYSEPSTQTSNNIFLQLLSYIGINKDTLTEDSLKKYWTIIFKKTLSKESPRQKLKFFQQSDTHSFSIEFIKVLPSINTHFSRILIHKKAEKELMSYWYNFQAYTKNNHSLFPDYKDKDFTLNTHSTYQDLIDHLTFSDESINSENRKKNIILLFFMYLTGSGLALLPTSLIFSNDSFIFHTSRLKYLKKFQTAHCFTRMPYNKDHIQKELETNSKAKRIFYYRFSYLVNKNFKKISHISDSDISIVMDNMKRTKTKKMVLDNENPIRRCLYWHGAHSVSQSKAKAEKIVLSPLEILAPLGAYQSIKKLLDAFYRFFSSRINNAESRKYARETVLLLEYLYDIHEDINKEYLYKFFHTTLSTNEEGENELSSRFLQYLNQRKLSPSSKQDFQLIVAQAIENDYDLAGAFPSSFLVTLYSMPRTRNIARLALSKKITDKMKSICLFEPAKDNYYIPTSISKKNMIWQHFDKVEPQLPVMLFLHLCMPWRSEHIKSLDRDTFLQMDEHGEVIGVQITTDKAQDNDFYIEREFFDYAFNFSDTDKKAIDTIALLQETIEYSKQSFPLLQAELRKENPNWGKIKPILCSNKSNGFISTEAYTGYYYKILLKALYDLGYNPEEIEYYVQLSPLGIEKFGSMPKTYDVIDDLTCGRVNTYFNSKFFSPHSLRKSNITYLVNDKRSFEFILRLSGHQALGTVLQVYIDYNLLSSMGVSEETITSIEENFRTDNTKAYAKDIIENFKKYHFTDSHKILSHIEKNNLFFSIYSLDKSLKSLKKNKTNDKLILAPAFWDFLSTGICTNALNCPTHIRNRCSLCPHFLTGPKFFSAINSKVMQLTTKVVEYFKIIDKHNLDENLDSNEAIIYEEEAQNDLAELQGYIAIAQKLNNSIYRILQEHMPENDIKNLPVPEEFDVILTKHIPYLSAQLEIYKATKQNMDFNPSTQFSTSALYEKIMELIILDEIPRELFSESISLNNPEKAIDTLIGVLDNYGNMDQLETIAQQFLPEHPGL